MDLELAYQRGDTSVSLATCSSQLPYTIDFTTMEQTRHGYGTRRSIQRQPLLKGSLQSYLQIHSNTVPTGNVLAAPMSSSSPRIGSKSAGSASLSSSSTGKSSYATRKREAKRRRINKSAGVTSSSSGIYNSNMKHTQTKSMCNDVLLADRVMQGGKYINNISIILSLLVVQTVV